MSSAVWAALRVGFLGRIYDGVENSMRPQPDDPNFLRLPEPDSPEGQALYADLEPGLIMGYADAMPRSFEQALVMHRQLLERQARYREIVDRAYWARAVLYATIGEVLFVI